MTNSTFDRYANEYEAALARGLDVTGEDSAYYAEHRIAFMSRSLRHMRHRARTILDFGCGTGASSPALLDAFDAQRVVGTDVSRQSLEIARSKHERSGVEYLPDGGEVAREPFDLVYCNGVFHHIRPPARRRVVERLHNLLIPGGIFAIWENNPWNLAVHYVMSRIPFDADARMLSPLQARELLRTCGFRILRVDFLFIFPRAMSRFRRVERFLTRLPFGAQYQILCRREW